MPDVPPHPLGILVIGDNHFIVRGPEPDHATAYQLARRWTFIEIGAKPIENWTISTKEFRENLTWAVIIPSEVNHSLAVTQLLNELQARGIEIHRLNSA